MDGVRRLIASARFAAMDCGLVRLTKLARALAAEAMVTNRARRTITSGKGILKRKELRGEVGGLEERGDTRVYEDDISELCTAKDASVASFTTKVTILAIAIAIPEPSSVSDIASTFAPGPAVRWPSRVESQYVTMQEAVESIF